MSKIENAEVLPVTRISGEITVPGDKSLSHRVAMLSTLARGSSRIRGFLRSEDCLHTLGAIRALGAEVTDEPSGELVVIGIPDGLRQPAMPLDMGNSGTGMRLVTGFVAGHPIQTELTGDASLCSRPMGRIAKPLTLMGAGITLKGADERPPILVHGGNLHGIEYDMPMASAQVKSAILLAGLYADGETVVREPRPCRDHTERLFQAMHIPLQINGLEIRLTGFVAQGPTLEARDWAVPGDFSSAAFWLVAAAARPGDEVVVRNVGLNPRRTALLNVLERMGANIEIELDRDPAWMEPTGTIRVRGAALQGTSVAGDEVPNLIDEIPLVAVLGALAAGDTTISEAAELRVKESDRIAVTCTNLRALNIDVDEKPDGMIVHGGAEVKTLASIDSHGDHRIAMAMAVLALHGYSPVSIGDIACIRTSYPLFWDDYARIGGKSVAS